MNSLIFNAFIAFYVLEQLFEAFLVIQNGKYSTSADKSIPKELKDYLNQETYEKSKLYVLANQKVKLVGSAFSALILLILLLSGTFNYVDQLIRSWGFSENINGVIFILGISLGSQLLGIPLALYHTFVVEERFGFNKTTPKLFVLDLLKGFILGIILMAPLFYALLFLIDVTGRFWWIWGAGLLVGFQLIISYVYPVFIAPLFNKFTPLAEGDLKTAINQLASSAQFPLKEVYLMDGSKRSARSNAYFTGFGGNKRIVLFDTLVQQLSTNELVMVLAHEIGHWTYKHIPKKIVSSSVLILSTFFLMSLLLKYTPFYDSFGVVPSNYMGIFLFGIYFSPLSYWFSPFFSYFSRKDEFQADAFAARQKTGSEWLISALIKLNVNNLGNIHPHPWTVTFHYSHPPLMQRIEAIQRP